MYLTREDSDKTALVINLLWVFAVHLYSIVYSTREDSDKTALLNSLLWVFAVHLCSIMYVTREDSDKTALVINLLWGFAVHLYSIVYSTREDSDKTALLNSLLWVFAVHLCSIMYVTRYYSDKTELVNSLLWAFADNACSIWWVSDLGSLWQDCTCVQFRLSLRLSLVLHMVCKRAGKTLTRPHLCTVSPWALAGHLYYCKWAGNSLAGPTVAQFEVFFSSDYLWVMSLFSSS